MEIAPKGLYDLIFMDIPMPVMNGYEAQSVAALAFIAVLIVLLLILTVMVHMRNRKLKSTLEEQMAERRNQCKKMNLKQCDNFNYAADQYAVQYLYGKERQEFKNWILTGHLKEQLSRKERITYHYRSKPNPNQHKFFEAQAVKIYQDEKDFLHWWVSGISMISWKRKLRSRIS